MSSGDLFGDASQLQSPPVAPQARFDLRPLSTGEVLDRTFQVYRSRFVLFAGITLLPAAVGAGMTALRLLYQSRQDLHAPVGAALYRAQAATVILALLAYLLALVVFAIAEAATTWAVSAVYLGEPASIRSAYKFAFRHWFRYLVIRLRQAWAVAWLPAVLFTAGIILAVISKRGGGRLLWPSIALFFLAVLSLVYGVWAYLRISLAVPASVVESLGVNAAVRRSKQLLVNRKIRIFLLLLLLLALYFVVGMIESPVLILAVRSRGLQAFITQAINLGINFVAGTLIGPVAAIGMCLFYFDERVRREGFDIEWMMKKLAPDSERASELPQSRKDSTETI